MKVSGLYFTSALCASDNQSAARFFDEQADADATKDCSRTERAELALCISISCDSIQITSCYLMCCSFVRFTCMCRASFRVPRSPLLSFKSTILIPNYLYYRFCLCMMTKTLKKELKLWGVCSTIMKKFPQYVYYPTQVSLFFVSALIRSTIHKCVRLLLDQNTVMVNI